MKNDAGGRSSRAGVVTLAFSLLAATAATPDSAVAQEADFLFRTPSVTFGFFGGMNRTAGESQVFAETRDLLTIGPRDFDSPAFRGELAVRVTPRVDIAFDVGHMRTEIDSEFRDFVEEVGGQDVPIRQTTTLSQVPATLSGKYYLRDRGRSVGRFAWIPSVWAPYVGAGIGVVRYDFRQRGDFVLEETLEIVTATLQSQATGPAFQLLGGAEVSLGPRFLIVGDLRYRWAKATMKDDWVELDDIDLSGLLGTVGLAVRL